MPTYVKKICKIFKENRSNKNELIILLTFYAWIIGEIYFNITMPYSCTMNARYIPILFIISAMFIGNEISDKSENKTNKYIITAITSIMVILSTYISLI